MFSQYWLSFTNESLPEGERWLGAVIVNATDTLGAIIGAHALGINPGGAVRVYQLPAGSIGPEWTCRLLTRDEVQAVPCPPWAQTN